MATTYSTNLQLIKIGTGEQAGTWGDTTNYNIGTLVEQAISGYATVSFALGDVTLTMDPGLSCTARNIYLELTGATAARTLTVPGTAPNANNKLYFVYNNSGYAITVKVASQTGVTLPNGAKSVLVCNGTDVVPAVNYISGTTSGLFVNSSGSVGIGTSSPVSKLDVSGTISTSGYQAAKYTMYGYGSYGTIQIGVPGNIYGNVALGVDVSTISGPAFQGTNQVILPSNGVLFPNAAGTNFIGAIGRNSSDSILLGPSMVSGIPTGDMVIDTSGKVGIGMSNPFWNLHVYGSSPIIASESSTNIGGQFVAKNTAGSYTFGVTGAVGGAWLLYDNTNSTTMYTSAYTYHIFNTQGTERVRINSSGFVGIGTSNPENPLTVKTVFPAGYIALKVEDYQDSSGVYCASVSGGLYKYISADSNYNNSGYFKSRNTTSALMNLYNGAVSFCTDSGLTPEALFAPTERMRIDSSGNVMIGTTNTNPIANNVSGNLISPIGSVNISRAGSVLECGRLSTTGGLVYFYYNNTNIAGNISINSASTVGYNQGSDERLKENIVDAGSAIDHIQSMKVRAFDWKADGIHNKYGFIAQELVQIADYAVYQPSDPDEMMGIDFGKLVPALVKCVQELKSELDSVKSQLATLQGN